MGIFGTCGIYSDLNHCHYYFLVYYFILLFYFNVIYYYFPI
jgi:hypothetical protein